MSETQSETLFEVECTKCHGKFILDKEPDADWKCICTQRPKPWSILNHCSAGHVTWLKSMNADCEECQKQKTINTAKKLLLMQSDPKRQEIEQSIVKTDQIIRQKKEDYIKREKLIDDSIIATPALLKEIITTLNDLKKEGEIGKKLDGLESQIKEMEAKFAE